MNEEKETSKKKQMKFSPGTFILGIIVLFALILVFTSFFIVDATEQAVITRFGRYHKTLGSGLQFKLPLGIDKSYNIPVKVVQTEQFGYKTIKGGITNKYSNEMFKESTMLTGDLNIVDVEWIIQYRIVDPSAWLFNVKDKQQTIRDISQSVINTLVGDRAILDVMTTERSSIQNNAVEMMNDNFKSLGLGINIITVQLQNVVPPADVQAAFEDVNKASQDMERFINEGLERYNAEIPLAKGVADQQIQIAEGYAINKVNRAQGDVSRFLAVYDEYRKAPSVTRDRLYLEAMEQIFKAKQNTTLVDKELQNILPIKNLGGAQ